jgi:hypothetical protein
MVAADLHYNHPHSRKLAEDLIDRMNAVGGDVLLVIGDTAVGDGDHFEKCLSRFNFAGPKLVVPGNHELWTNGADSYALLNEELPRRAKAIGWHWLMDSPVVIGEIGFVGSLGWYDYSFAQSDLGIPRRFYERKISPGVAERESQYADLLKDISDVPIVMREFCARWNDGVHVKLGRSDEQFLAELLAKLERQLREVASVPTVIAAIHCLPFKELLPPPHSAQWDFAKAYLGSGKIGELLLKFPNVKRVYCGHSHFPARSRIGGIEAINIGSGYRAKFYRADDVL